MFCDLLMWFSLQGHRTKVHTLSLDVIVNPSCSQRSQTIPACYVPPDFQSKWGASAFLHSLMAQEKAEAANGVGWLPWRRDFQVSGDIAWKATLWYHSSFLCDSPQFQASKSVFQQLSVWSVDLSSTVCVISICTVGIRRKNRVNPQSERQRKSVH